MIYLSGHVCKYRHPRLGFLLTPDTGHYAPIMADIAIDNGCFTNPEGYSDERFEGYLRKMPRDRTLFATAPDALGDHPATVRRARPLLKRIKRLGFRAAFIAQDGWDEATTPWEEFDVLFIGGTTRFKFRGGRDAALAAKRHGKKVHMGRVNSLERLRAAFAIGCDSVDGTFLRFAPETNWPRFTRWFDQLHLAPGLAL